MSASANFITSDKRKTRVSTQIESLNKSVAYANAIFISFVVLFTTDEISNANILNSLINHTINKYIFSPDFDFMHEQQKFKEEHPPNVPRNRVAPIIEQKCCFMFGIQHNPVLQCDSRILLLTFHDKKVRGRLLGDSIEDRDLRNNIYRIENVGLDALNSITNVYSDGAHRREWKRQNGMCIYCSIPLLEFDYERDILTPDVTKKYIYSLVERSNSSSPFPAINILQTNSPCVSCYTCSVLAKTIQPLSNIHPCIISDMENTIMQNFVFIANESVVPDINEIFIYEITRLDSDPGSRIIEMLISSSSGMYLQKKIMTCDQIDHRKIHAHLLLINPERAAETTCDFTQKMQRINTLQQKTEETQNPSMNTVIQSLQECMIFVEGRNGSTRDHLFVVLPLTRRDNGVRRKTEIHTNTCKIDRNDFCQLCRIYNVENHQLIVYYPKTKSNQFYVSTESDWVRKNLVTKHENSVKYCELKKKSMRALFIYIKKTFHTSPHSTPHRHKNTPELIFFYRSIYEKTKNVDISDGITKQSVKNTTMYVFLVKILSTIMYNENHTQSVQHKIPFEEFINFGSVFSLILESSHHFYNLSFGDIYDSLDYNNRQAITYNVFDNLMRTKFQHICVASAEIQKYNNWSKKQDKMQAYLDLFTGTKMNKKIDELLPMYLLLQNFICKSTDQPQLASTMYTERCHMLDCIKSYLTYHR